MHGVVVRPSSTGAVASNTRIGFSGLETWRKSQTQLPDSRRHMASSVPSGESPTIHASPATKRAVFAEIFAK
jgi:hypothetical protein